MFVHFSPRQNKSGVLVYHHDGLTLNLLVLPKMWNPKETLNRIDPWRFVREPTESKTVQIVAYEGERHHIDFDKNNKYHKRWEALLTSCCDMLSSKSNTTHDTDESDEFDADTLTSLNGLMTIISKPPQQSLTIFDSLDPFDQASQTDDDPWVQAWNTSVGHLFNLAFYCDSNIDLHTNIFQNKDDSIVALTEDDEQQTDSPIFKVLAIENFVSEMEQHVHKIHQGYVKTTERLDTIRGSVTGTSLMMLDAGISLKPECRYNKFVPNVPLYQVLVTTLDAIQKGWCIPQVHFVQQLSMIKKLKKRASRLRSKLQHITSLPIEVARYTSQRVHLNRLQTFWKPAVNLSKILLCNKPVLLESTVSGTGGHMWLVNTAKVWESILAQAIRTQDLSNDDIVKTHVKTKQSWTGRGGQPDADLVAKTNDCLYIFDAKYKISGRDNKSPTKAEEYQMFAYSHLLPAKKSSLRANIEGIHLGLVYPTFSPKDYPNNRYINEGKDKGKNNIKEPKENLSTFNRGTHNETSGTQCTLSIYYLAFPSPNDVETQDTWTKKMKVIGEQWTGIKTGDDNTTEPFSKKWDKYTRSKDETKDTTGTQP